MKCKWCSRFLGPYGYKTWGNLKFCSIQCKLDYMAEQRRLQEQERKEEFNFWKAGLKRFLHSLGEP